MQTQVVHAPASRPTAKTAVVAHAQAAVVAAALPLPDPPSPMRPSHIVVFNRAGRGPINAVAKNMSMSAHAVKGRKGVTAFFAMAGDPGSPGKSGKPGKSSAVGISALPGVAMARAYERVGAMAATLTPAQATQVAHMPDVAGVFVNEVRSIPKPVRQSVNVARAPSGAGSEVQLAYLRGMRDAVQLAIDAAMGGTATSPARRADAVVATAALQLSWCLQQIGITAKYRRATGKGIRVAVLDTGIDRTHPDLVARIAAYRNFAAGSSDQDVVEHGTHCAGVIGAAKSPTTGVRYSVAPSCQLLVGKVLDDNGNGFDDDILEAIDWALDEGARVISMSLVSKRPAGGAASNAYELVASNLFDLPNGALLVAAAGNESSRPGLVAPVCNPAACASIMSVAAVDRDFNVAEFSCGKVDAIGAIDMSGPGVDVLSAQPGGRAQLMSGTSMATPHVAGVAALFAQRHPTFTPRQLWAKIQETARNLGKPNDCGSGMVQVP